MFPTHDGQLLRDDPEQAPLFEGRPEPVDTETGEIING